MSNPISDPGLTLEEAEALLAPRDPGEAITTGKARRRAYDKVQAALSAPEDNTGVEKTTTEGVMEAIVLALGPEATVWLEHDLREVLAQHNVGARDDEPDLVDNTGVEKAVEELAKRKVEQHAAHEESLDRTHVHWIHLSHEERDEALQEAREDLAAIQPFLTQPSELLAITREERGALVLAVDTAIADQTVSDSLRLTLLGLAARMPLDAAEVPGNSGGVKEGPEFTVNAPGGLSAEEHREVGELVTAAHAKMAPGSLAVGVRALRDELQKLLDRHAPQLPHSPLSERAEGVRAERKATVRQLDGLLASAPTQPVLPQPQLSDEDRDQIKRAAGVLAEVTEGPDPHADELIAFLRKLASQPQQPEWFCIACGHGVTGRTCDGCGSAFDWQQHGEVEEDGPPKSLTREEREQAEAEGRAAGQCIFCEGGMDAFGGVHTKACPITQPQVAQHQVPTKGQEGR